MSEQPQVTVQTLSNIVKIIDVCTKRGAFQASELALVGKTYDELNNFVKAFQAQQELNKVEAGEESTEGVSDNTEAVSDNTEAVSDNTEAVSDNTEAVGYNTEAVSDNTEVVSDNTEVVNDTTEQQVV